VPKLSLTCAMSHGAERASGRLCPMHKAPDPYRAVVAAMSDEDLTEAAAGCTELTCPYHRVVNAERRERGLL